MNNRRAEAREECFRPLLFRRHFPSPAGTPTKYIIAALPAVSRVTRNRAPGATPWRAATWRIPSGWLKVYASVAGAVGNGRAGSRRSQMRAHVLG